MVKIAVVGAGYVGMANAILLAQHNDVCILDISPEKVSLINEKKLPFQDSDIENYLATKKLNLFATIDSKTAYKNADFIVIATPTNYDTGKGYFDTSSIESVVADILKINETAVIVIKSTVPVGFTQKICDSYKEAKLIFSRSFCVKVKPCMTIFIQAGL